MPRRHSSFFALTATLLLVAGCGASVPTNQEAATAVSTAIESTRTSTLPAATYCMTTNPDFSFANLGQVDFVEMLQNVKDKAPLFDAAIAGVVRVELKEFPFNPAGRSPDPSCDAVHAQSRQSGYMSGQVRLAMVRTTLTPKGTAAGIQFDMPIDIATREVVDVTDIRSELGGCELYLAVDADRDGRAGRLHASKAPGSHRTPPPIRRRLGRERRGSQIGNARRSGSPGARVDDAELRFPEHRRWLSSRHVQ